MSMLILGNQFETCWTKTSNNGGTCRKTWEKLQVQYWKGSGKIDRHFSNFEHKHGPWPWIYLTYLVVSWNRTSPKSSMAFSIINHPAMGVPPISGKPHMNLFRVELRRSFEFAPTRSSKLKSSHQRRPEVSNVQGSLYPSMPGSTQLVLQDDAP